MRLSKDSPPSVETVSRNHVPLIPTPVVVAGPHMGTGATRAIAYFSAEFALHQSLPIYAGGLGVLAGDHCKEASDLGIPLVGVGFMYPQGYFHQHVSPEGWQQEAVEYIDWSDAPITRSCLRRIGANSVRVMRSAYVRLAPIVLVGERGQTQTGSGVAQAKLRTLAPLQRVARLGAAAGARHPAHNASSAPVRALNSSIDAGELGMADAAAVRTTFDRFDQVLGVLSLIFWAILLVVSLKYLAIVLRTFSKAYGLASLRVGYGLSTAVVADVLNRVRQPFNVNSFALGIRHNF